METTAECGHRVTLPGEADRVPASIPARVRPGDVWRLGAHLVRCADVADPAGAPMLAADGPVGALIWDPPWDRPLYPPEWLKAEATFVFTDNSFLQREVAAFGPPSLLLVWDCVSADVRAGRRPLKQTKLCLFYGDPSGYNWRGDTWDRRVPRPVRTTGCQLGEVFRMSIAALYRHGRRHQKPVDWVRRLIGCLSTGTVVDPMLGSGTTLIACEQLGRVCRGGDVDPGALDVALARWEAWTGRRAELEARGD